MILKRGFFSGYDSIWITAFQIAAVGVIWYVIKMNSLSSELWLLKLALVDTLGFIILLLAQGYILTRALKYRITVKENLTFGKSLWFGAMSFGLGKFLSMFTVIVLINNLLPNLGPAANTLSFLLLPGTAIIGSITGFGISFVYALIKGL